MMSGEDPELGKARVELEEARKARDAAAKKLEDREADIREAARVVREHLAEDRTTGDRLLDHVLNHVPPDHQTGELERLRELERQMADKRGQWCLLVYEEEHMTMHRFIGPHEYETRTRICCGRLTDTQLVLPTLGTDNHPFNEYGERVPVRTYVKMPAHELSMLEGPMEPQTSRLMSLLRLYPSDMGLLYADEDPTSIARLYVGDDRVSEMINDPKMAIHVLNGTAGVEHDIRNPEQFADDLLKQIDEVTGQLFPNL